MFKVKLLAFSNVRVCADRIQRAKEKERGETEKQLNK